MALKKPVLVLALYDIGRDNWDNFTMSYHTYLSWMRNTLSFDVEMVIYTEIKFAKMIKDDRRLFDPNFNKTKVIIQPLETLPAYIIWYHKLKKLMESQEFKNKVDHDVPEMNKPLYNIIMFNKLFWLKDTKDNGYFNNDSTVWVDAGCFREDINNYQGKTYPQVNLVPPKHPLFFSHHEVISIHNIYDHALSQMRFIHGTSFIVPNIALESLIEEFSFTVDHLISEGYIGSDEKIFDITYKRNPSKYKLIKCDWRQYKEVLA